MFTLLMPQVAAVEEAAVEASHISKWWYGGFALFVLVLLLLVTVIMGKGRPHS
jgi:bacteriorhodopsin